MNASAATTVNDLLRPLAPQLNERQWLRISRILTACWGLAQMVMACVATRLQENVVVNALAIASFTTGIVLGLFLLGIFTKVGQTPALTGLIAGIAAVSFAKFATPLARRPVRPGWGPRRVFFVGLIVGRSLTFPAISSRPWILPPAEPGAARHICLTTGNRRKATINPRPPFQ